MENNPQNVPTGAEQEARPNRKKFRLAGLVELLLALCAVVSYFQEEALFITFFGGLLKGLLGYGYWLSAPALLLTGLLLLTHRDCPATLRSVCTLLVPVLTGCGLHLLLCARSYEPGLTGLRELWLSGRSLQSGRSEEHTSELQSQR